MKKLLLAITAMVSVATAAEAQQVTGGLEQNKNQAIESLNKIRFQQVNKMLSDMSKAVQEDMTQVNNNVSNMDTKYEKLLNGPNGNDGLLNKIAELEVIIKKVASCKPKTTNGCSLPLTPLDETSNGGCASGYVKNNTQTGFFYVPVPDCTAKCDLDNGFQVITNHCRLPKSCAAASSISIPSYLWPISYSANIPGGAHNSTKSVTCSSTGACMADNNKSYLTNYTCNVKCNDGNWTLVNKTNETQVRTCPQMKFNTAPIINLGF